MEYSRPLSETYKTYKNLYFQMGTINSTQKTYINL